MYCGPLSLSTLSVLTPQDSAIRVVLKMYLQLTLRVTDTLMR